MNEPTSRIEELEQHIAELEEEIAEQSVAILRMIADGKSTRTAEAAAECNRVRLRNLRRYLAKLTGSKL